MIKSLGGVYSTTTGTGTGTRDLSIYAKTTDVTAAIQVAEDYTDLEISLIPDVDLTEYATIISLNLGLEAANNYTDYQISLLPLTDLSLHSTIESTQNAITAAIQVAEDYTDLQISLIPDADFSGYATIDSLNLSNESNNNYTDSQIALIPVTDLSLHSTIQSVQEAISTAVNLVESYTDIKISEIEPIDLSDYATVEGLANATKLSTDYSDYLHSLEVQSIAEIYSFGFATQTELSSAISSFLVLDLSDNAYLLDVSNAIVECNEFTTQQIAKIPAAGNQTVQRSSSAFDSFLGIFVTTTATVTLAAYIASVDAKASSAAVAAGIAQSTATTALAANEAVNLKVLYLNTFGTIQRCNAVGGFSMHNGLFTVSTLGIDGSLNLSSSLEIDPTGNNVVLSLNENGRIYSQNLDCVSTITTSELQGNATDLSGLSIDSNLNTTELIPTINIGTTTARQINIGNSNCYINLYSADGGFSVINQVPKTTALEIRQFL